MSEFPHRIRPAMVDSMTEAGIRHRAIRCVASMATDARDARDLLDALGLDPAEGRIEGGKAA